jgi:hypothetical protein
MFVKNENNGALITEKMLSRIWKLVNGIGQNDDPGFLIHELSVLKDPSLGCQPNPVYQSLMDGTIRDVFVDFVTSHLSSCVLCDILMLAMQVKRKEIGIETFRNNAKFKLERLEDELAA